MDLLAQKVLPLDRSLGLIHQTPEPQYVRQSDASFFYEAAPSKSWGGGGGGRSFLNETR